MCLLSFLLQVDFPGPELFPGVTLFFWPVSRLYSPTYNSYNTYCITGHRLFTCPFTDIPSVLPPLVYGVEVLLKITGLGPMAYITNGWNLWVITGFFSLIHKWICAVDETYSSSALFTFSFHCWRLCVFWLKVFWNWTKPCFCTFIDNLDSGGVSRFDFSVTVFAFLGLIALAFDMEPFYFIVVLRPFQLLRCAFTSTPKIREDNLMRHYCFAFISVQTFFCLPRLSQVV